jgi:probable F420-dependent oxidoreductase
VERACDADGKPLQGAVVVAVAAASGGLSPAYCSTVHVDVMTVPQPLDKVGDLARRTQAAGFDGILFTETGRTAYLNAAVASQAAPGLELSTGVAVAFPRSPFVTAATAWELQEATGGKFRLGLGTQVRTHVVRRYGMEFERPGPRLRDYVRAVKACFEAFRTGKLDHHGEFYDLDFITPQWSAGPIDAPDPKVDVAAVNPWMLRMAGEVADGVHVHPLGEPGYIARHVVPNVAVGAAKSGRSVSDIAVIAPVMTIVGDSDEERHNERELVRASMSFYGSTPNYAFIWDEAGFEGMTARIREKQKAGDIKGMAAQITDEHIATFATESTWDGLADALTAKYDGIATRIVLYNALGDQDRLERYGAVAQRISVR